MIVEKRKSLYFWIFLIILVSFFNAGYSAVRITVNNNLSLGNFVTLDGSSASSGSFNLNGQTGIIDTSSNIKTFINPTVASFRVTGGLLSDFPILISIPKTHSLGSGSNVSIDLSLTMTSKSLGVTCTSQSESGGNLRYCCTSLLSITSGNADFNIGGSVTLSSGFSPSSPSIATTITAVHDAVNC